MEIVTLGSIENSYIIERLYERDKSKKLPKVEIIINQIEKWKNDNLRFYTKKGLLKSNSENMLSQYSNLSDLENYNDKYMCFDIEMLNNLYCFIINKNWHK